MSQGIALMDPETVAANARAAVQVVAPGRLDDAPLRLAYLTALRDAQGSGLEIESAGPVFQLDLAAPVSVATIRGIGGKDVTAVEIGDTGRERLRAHLDAGFALLEEHDPDRAAVARLLVATLVVLRRPGLFSASAISALGAVAVNPAPEWEAIDFAETLLHESVHQAVFLDEMVNTLYGVDPKRLAADDALVLSAVRRTARPYDAALHAACVAVEVLWLHAGRDDAERVAQWSTGLTDSVAQLTERRHLLSAHGNEVLDDLERAVDAAPVA
jgi:HEXXH motif-containing protein